MTRLFFLYMYFNYTGIACAWFTNARHVSRRMRKTGCLQFLRGKDTRGGGPGGEEENDFVDCPLSPRKVVFSEPLYSKIDTLKGKQAPFFMEK